MRSVAAGLIVLAGFNGLAVATNIQATSGADSAEVVDIIMRFAATDGTPLEAKLSLPAGAKGAVPVQFHLHGAGPRNFDNAVGYRDAGGQVRTVRYYDFYSHELASRGLPR